MAKTSSTPASTKPWKRQRPASKKTTTRLTPEHKARAKATATRAGRRYPNLVDNMREAAAQRRERAPATKATKKSKTSAKSTAKKTATRKRTSRAGTRKASR